MLGDRFQSGKRAAHTVFVHMGKRLVEDQNGAFTEKAFAKRYAHGKIGSVEGARAELSVLAEEALFFGA